jgi:general secretion pathway protein H
LLSDTEKAGDIAKSSLVREVDLAFVASGEYSPFKLNIRIIDDTSDGHSFLLEGDGVNALELSEN